MNKPPDRFVLTPQDRDSAAWARLASHFNERIQTLHNKLELNQTPEETAMLRGEIKAYRNLLSLAKDLPPQQ